MTRQIKEELISRLKNKLTVASFTLQLTIKIMKTATGKMEKVLELIHYLADGIQGDLEKLGEDNLEPATRETS